LDSSTEAILHHPLELGGLSIKALPQVRLGQLLDPLRPPLPTHLRQLGKERLHAALVPRPVGNSVLGCVPQLMEDLPIHQRSGRIPRRAPRPPSFVERHLRAEIDRAFLKVLPHQCRIMVRIHQHPAEPGLEAQRLGDLLRDSLQFSQQGPVRFSNSGYGVRIMDTRRVNDAYSVDLWGGIGLIEEVGVTKCEIVSGQILSGDGCGTTHQPLDIVSSSGPRPLVDPRKGTTNRLSGDEHSLHPPLTRQQCFSILCLSHEPAHGHVESGQLACSSLDLLAIRFYLGGSWRLDISDGRPSSEPPVSDDVAGRK
jgi:hypothetical protein